MAAGTDSVRRWLHDYLLTACFVGVVILGVIGVGLLRGQIAIQRNQLELMRTQVEMQKVYTAAVKRMGESQLPTSLATSGTVGGRPFTLGMQEQRSEHDIETLVDRHVDGIMRVEGHWPK